MGTPSFAKAASFPVARAYYTPGRTLWKIDVKEWAFATVDATDVDPALNIGSNNPTVVPGFFDKSPRAIKYTAASSGSGGAVRLYANSTGYTFVNFFRLPLFDVVGGLLQVHIVERRSASSADVQLTKLNGKTFAINAPDTVTYDMDKTVVSTAAEASEGGVFAKVEAGTNHVVVSSHGTLESKTAKNICLWAAGESSSFRINDGNVASTFGVLKGKVADDCVIWIGGCTMAQNNPWCKAAAKAAGCHLVAPVNYTTIQKFPKGNIDLLDRSLGPKVFPPDGGEPIGVNDFCSQQDKFQFVVPP
ncbi:MAG: hypothetical protein LAP86_23325 [Acidobacteriia bacterium]|nr:hypothetical protein [Terriglobia bacterium]